MYSPKIPVSLQLWSVRNHVAKDFAATVAALAQMGYQGVETAGFGNLDAAGAAAALKAAGLVCSGMHVPIDALRQPERVLQDARLLGARHVICPWYPRELLGTAAECAALGEELARLALRFRAAGLQLHYHNHDGEIALIEGKTAFEHILDAAAPSLLGCEADVYWVKIGGQDPAAFIRRLGARIRLLHLKDKQELGTGLVDFPSIFAAIDSVAALEWQIIEVENYNHDPLESVRLSLEQLKAWGRA